MIRRLSQIVWPTLALAGGLFISYLLARWLRIDTASLGFLLGFPFVAGAVIVFFRPKDRFQRFLPAMAWLTTIMCLAVALAFIDGLEGMICIAMGIFPIVFFAMLGGTISLLALRWRADTRGASGALVIPALALIFLDLLPTEPKTYLTSNSIVIAAPPQTVFAMIKDVPDIHPEEIETRLIHLLGIPKATRAVWKETPKGAVRHSYWAGGVHFREKITAYEAGRRIAWEFDIPAGWLPDGVDDPHVAVGGRYFDVLAGEYLLEDLNGRTRLTLTTWTYDSSKFGVYAEFWHHFFFDGIHKGILALIRDRAEAHAGSRSTSQSG
ncbi:SRPBCC family protein [Frigidibacter sp. SD6-1]|uniref:SRPBCC family protein n=1 Tax=Frigidibacter sp. SD6-1 TaxID=3032581 RepID=UPI0024DF3776|nr:SRPBCC family protein [Frigidibacter sp. SD6-1]